MTTAATATRMPKPFPPPWAAAWGDDLYGLWAELEVKGVTQRMRWIERGEFLMGSPDTENGRDTREGPQHAVRLTKGYWLADTACTQALWQAVMGNNPSDVTDNPQKPVERVRRDDAVAFLQTLSGLDGLPRDLEAVLPSEAEWEYACRAGTTGAYNLRDTISAATVNVNHEGNWQKREEEKRTTVPVKHYPPNAWGLYQMHGNVWEWCADAMRTYKQDAVTDPSGATGKEVKSFAVRGGSWSSYAQFARSARRRHDGRGRRDIPLGFRFALRSTAQGAGGPGTAERR